MLAGELLIFFPTDSRLTWSLSSNVEESASKCRGNILLSTPFFHNTTLSFPKKRVFHKPQNFTSACFLLSDWRHFILRPMCVGLHHWQIFIGSRHRRLTYTTLWINGGSTAAAKTFYGLHQDLFRHILFTGKGLKTAGYRLWSFVYFFLPQKLLIFFYVLRASIVCRMSNIYIFLI
jgi:hypothetical protein